jgi:hypothetical protein
MIALHHAEGLNVPARDGLRRMCGLGRVAGLGVAAPISLEWRTRCVQANAWTGEGVEYEETLPVGVR